MEQIAAVLTETRRKTPLVHFITNYVTVNECANITLAAGGSPIMADEIQEIEDIVNLCAAVVINIGTLNERTVPAMIAAGRCANKWGRPVVLDPVGAGASGFRNQTVEQLMRDVNFTVIKGNISEMEYLSGGAINTKGVDASGNELVTEEILESKLKMARELSLMAGAVIVISGPIDIVADCNEAYAVRNGHPVMTKITGTGCMSGAVVGSFLGANPEKPLLASVCAISAMGVCGEKAQRKMEQTQGGTGSLRTYLMDYMSQLDERQLKENMKIEHFTF